MTFFDYEIVQIIIGCLIPCLATLLVGLLVENKMEPWYSQLKKPSFNPPNWIFGPVWTYLYLSMGYASYRVWKEGGGFSGPAAFALAMYIIQLIVNITWSPVFFTLHLLGAATIHIFILLASVISTAVLFFEIDQTAGILIIPYVAWVSFASFLCYTLWTLNKNNPKITK